LTATIHPQSSTPPAQARVVIIGGGIIGCSIAYHLTQLGWRDVVLLERAQLTSGTTWHAAGLLTSLRDTETQTRLAKYSQELYARLEASTGQATGLIGCGSIQLAMTADKTEEMRRGVHMARCFGVEAHEVSPAEVKRFWPLAAVDDVRAAFYFPNDGRVNPTDVTQALAKGARLGGARIFENTPVTGVLRERGRAVGVRTAAGEIRAEFVVNCAGLWARAVGRLAGVNVPLQAAEHYYLISEPVAGVHSMLPILRDPGNSTYIREEAGKIMLGLFESQAKPWGVDGIPEDFSFGDIPPDWERMTPHIEKAMRRVPCLLETGIKLLFCGPESFTPDHNYIMGEAPNLEHFFVAAGFNSLGILSGGGAGMVMARWIAEGRAPFDVWTVNLRRMHRWQDNDRYLQDRVVETLGIGYQDQWPHRQPASARGVKKSVLHDRLAAAGACFGESAGWERPNWYARPGQPAAYVYGWGRQNWFSNNAAEHAAVRERVGVFEQSSFSKLLVMGRDAAGVLNRIATANVDVAVGRCVYTQFLNAAGGIEADLTITRLAADRFLVVTAPFAQPLYDALIEAGRSHGLRHCGYHTLNSLRIEKAYRDWPHDIGPSDTPLEAGLGFTCDWNKPGGFLGREALLAQRAAGAPSRRLVQFLLDDPEPLLHHNEPIYRDGEPVGFITSGMYGHTLGAAVGLGYVTHAQGCGDEFIATGRYEIETAAAKVGARASLAPLYDPKSARVRA
jgi:4-methylaminobutanoate oxidase (formaldehyde-forming)